MRMIVRDAECMVFEVNAQTLEPVSYSRHEPDCFSQPEAGVWYMSFSEWSSVTEQTRPVHARPSAAHTIRDAAKVMLARFWPDMISETAKPRK